MPHKDLHSHQLQPVSYSVQQRHTLNYMEADYELNNSLDANSSKYWKALRNRAGMDTDFQKQ